MGDAHDAADIAVFKPHLVEDEEEGVMGGLGSVFLLDAAERGEIDGLVEVDEAFVVVVRPTRGGAVFFDFIAQNLAPDQARRILYHQFANFSVQFLYLFYGIYIFLLALQLGNFADIVVDEYL